MELTGMFANTTDRANSPVGSWTKHTRNIIIGKDNKSILNENGFSLYVPNLPNDAIIIGDLVIRNDDIILWMLVDNVSQIGIVDEHGNYRRIIKDGSFNFDTNFPVVGKYRENYKGEVEIIFHDKKNDIRFINIDNIQAPLTTDGSLVNADDINKFKLFPDVIVPKFNLQAVAETGGSLQKGAYIYTVAYEDSTGAITNYTPTSNVVMVSANFNQDFAHTDGGETKDGTTKSIIMQLQEVDTRFKKVHVAVIHRNQGIVTVNKIKELNISGTTLNFTHTGNETSLVLPIGEVIVDRPSIARVDEIETDNDILYLAGIQTKPRINLQQRINNLQVKYITGEVNLNQIDGSFKDAVTIYFKRPFLHDEVYALYACPVMSDGSYGGAFHIPGRAPREIQEDWNYAALMENELMSEIPLVIPVSYLNEDNSISPGKVRYFHTRDTSSSDGTLSYWENQNEVYPDNDDSDIYDSTGKIGTLRGQKVRHHKMPSIIKHGYVNYDKRTAPIVGLNIYGLFLSEEEWKDIQYIEIFYAKRTAYNSTVLGQSLLFFASTNLDNDPNTIDTSGGNIRLNKPLVSDRKELRNDYIRFHAFDMLLDKASVMPTHLINQKKLTTKVVIESNNSSSPIIFNVNTNEKALTTVSDVARENQVRKLSEQQFVPFDTIFGENKSNRYAEEVFFARLVTKGFMGIEPANMMNGDDSYTPNQSMQMFLTNMYSWKEDTYLSFDEQELVSTNMRIYPDESNVSGFGGDSYFSPYGFMTSASSFETDRDIEDAPDGIPRDGLKGKYFVFVESANNIGLRYGEYYNKTAYTVEKLGLEPLATKRELLYNKDYTTVNSYNPVFVFDPDNTQDYFYNRIYRSKKSNREEKVSSWRIFLPNDYYEAAKNRGKIVNITAVQGELLIQHERGLYTTQGKDSLQTSGALVQVGSGDIFAREPREIIDTENGYVGTQNRLGCLKFKGGYVSVDAKQGRIFILDDRLDEVSSRGISDILEDGLKFVGNNDDNPYTANGITIGYDDKNKRIILTKLDNAGLSFTLSYHIPGKYWVAYHDYLPKKYITTANKLISIQARLHIHNVPNRKGRYYTDTVYPTTFEPVNTNPVTKDVLSIWMNTQVTKDNTIQNNRTIDKILLYNRNQCSGIRDIVVNKNTRYAQNMWRFNEFKDIVINMNNPFIAEDGNIIPTNINLNMPFYKKKIFSDNYLCIRFIFNNLFSNEELTLSDYYINENINYR